MSFKNIMKFIIFTAFISLFSNICVYGADIVNMGGIEILTNEDEYSIYDYNGNLLNDNHINQYCNQFLQKTNDICFINENRVVIKSSTGLSIVKSENLYNFIRKSKYSTLISNKDSETNIISTDDIVNDKFSENSSGTLSGKNIYSANKIASIDNLDVSYINLKLDVPDSDSFTNVRIVIPSSAFIYSEKIPRLNEYVDYNISKDDAPNPLYGLSDGTITTYNLDYNIAKSTEKALIEIKKAVQEGIVAASVELGYNVGSLYSEKQLPLVDIMQEDKESQGVYEFKANANLRAGLDYFVSPLFGKMKIEDGVPQTAEEWNKLAYDLNISLGSIEINSFYNTFSNKSSPERLSIKPTDINLNFTNGVKQYEFGGVITKEPQKFVDYNMRIVVPYKFKHTGINNSYSLEENGLTVLQGLRMSASNDTVYQIDSDGFDILCTNFDLDLQREYLYLWNKIINGEPVGVIVVAKYSEAVMNTIDGYVYYTGRKIILNNNYSTSLKLDVSNSEVMGANTKSGTVGVKPRHFAFKDDASVDFNYINNTLSHSEISDGSPFTFLITFLGPKPDGEIDKGTEGINDYTNNETKEPEENAPTKEQDGDVVSPIANLIVKVNGEAKDAKVPYGFVIIRNNTYVKDNELLNWLATKEATSLDFVDAVNLRKAINGEFETEPLSYSDWKAMQEIKGELNYYKSNIVIRAINVILIIIGCLLLIIGVILPFAYWFDVFNTFTEFSILHFISRGYMYPISDESEVQYINKDKSNTKYVLFKDVLITSILFWILGVLFLNTQGLIQFLVSIYMFLMQRIGGLK